MYEPTQLYANSGSTNIAVSGGCACGKVIIEFRFPNFTFFQSTKIKQKKNKNNGQHHLQLFDQTNRFD